MTGSRRNTTRAAEIAELARVFRDTRCLVEDTRYGLSFAAPARHTRINRFEQLGRLATWKGSYRMQLGILTLLPVIALSAALETALPPPRSQTTQTPLVQPAAREHVPPGMTEIAGSRNPELIPDHAIWRMVFLRLTEIRRRGEEADLAVLLPLNKGDLAALYVEAMKQLTRDEDCRGRYKARQEALTQAKASPTAITQALDDLTIQCRSEDLDAADRVMDAVSDEGRRILSEYIESRRHSMSMLVPDRELKTYRLPR
jgi:hypothetical protein